MNLTGAQASAQRMLAQLNLVLTLTPVVPAGVAAATPLRINAGVFQARPMDDRFSGDAKVRSRQRLLYLSALTIDGAGYNAPKSDDIIAGLEGTELWRVLGNNPFRPDGVTAIYHEVVVQR